MATNPELELAYDYVSQTNRHLFLTGKAGTGKTTFLHRIRAELPKRMAVVAPTGVAAINAKGVTIHSLFQLPFGVLTPERTDREMRQKRFSAKKIELLKSLDLLVIDEISMVRADVLDGIDVVLRQVRRRDEPFGGLQLLMIGDLHQLPPVVKDSDWRELSPHYKTAYFFGSIALRKARARVVQLKHIYRQSDEKFIGLLNKVRNNQMDSEVFATLNERYEADFRPDEADGYITLSSHNASARSINERKLKELAGQEFKFTAETTGTFPESMYPNEETLTFKVGAQVMFNKNDSYPDRLYYNGKIGKITAIKKDAITVSCPGEDDIVVYPVIWENRKFEMGKSREVEENIIGTYSQHPLKLAWAITIHKSQGLTFDKVVIDAASAFAHGQVYVALSRCKTFEGIVLSSRIQDSSVRTDAVVSNYSAKAEEEQPSAEDLRADKHAYQLDCLNNLFTFTELEWAGKRMQKSLFEHERAIQGNAHAVFHKLHEEVKAKVIGVGHKFLPWLSIYAKDPTLPADHPELTKRLAGAAKYFTDYLGNTLLPTLEEFGIMTDNKSVAGQIAERLEDLRLQTFIKLKVFESIREGFEPDRFIRARADADAAYTKRAAKAAPTKTVQIEDLTHPELFGTLVDWRNATAREIEKPAYIVATNAVLIGISEALPTSKMSLQRIKGVGQKTVAAYGEVMLEMVDDYLDGKEIVTDLFQSIAGPKKPAAGKRSNTKQETLDLYLGGKSIAEVAKIRQLTTGTITTHLAHFVKSGDLPVTDLIEQEKIDAMAPFFRKDPEALLSDGYKYFDGKFTYEELRLGGTAAALEEE